MELTLLRHWIGGKAYEGPVERWGEVFNPATGESSTRVAFADATIVDDGSCPKGQVKRVPRQASHAVCLDRKRLKLN